MRPIGTTRAKKPIFKKEFDRLIRACNYSKEIKSPTKLKLIRAFTLLYMTGCRASEIINMTTADLTLMIRDNEYSLTNKTKTKTSRLISFDESRQQIEYFKKILPSDSTYLFPRNNANVPMTASALKLLMNTFIHSILGELYSSHSFRAGYITAFHQQGLSLEHIRQDIGHANIATTARYATVTSEEIARSKNHRNW
ncbi:MAG: site-specific integrase [Sulfuricurvum sp.]|uniref:tyrosine-type recombinase/integrase n=1 Tax=Sulfuricurvum sp. TaxID=2025608 RepID=UPI002604BFD9|nr:site-specific integrase [Sulfuricurvum sp.]MDD2829240.1 site-specific integrase [Sulfuricurvum sp.]